MLLVKGVVRGSYLNFVCAADYSEGSEIDTVVKSIVDKIAADLRLEQLEAERV